jgi:6-phosphogluconolactonase
MDAGGDRLYPGKKVPARRPQLVVTQDAEALAEAAARRLLDRIAETPGRAAICLTGGSTPEPLYRLLATNPYRSRMPWERTHWFMGDDRFVPPEDPLSNMGMVRRLFLDSVKAPRANVHGMPTTEGSPEIAARRYEAELKRFYGRDRLDPARPRFDVVLMGVGPDGHTASLFPHSPALQEKERWVVGVEQAGCEPYVPRVTLTFPALASTREMLFLVSGEEKRNMLARVLSGEDLPAHHAYSLGELVGLVVRAAAPAGHPVM